MPEVGEYIFTHVGFSREEKPTLTLARNSELIPFLPVGSVITVHFDTSARFCVGWHDLRTSKSYACPDSLTVNEKYDQCAACQQRTGFNPAFYHATTVSPQQEEFNLEPHILYLAHFGRGIIKVGISRAARQHSRLLEQGARSAVILDTFPTAHIARQYEAQIAALPGIAETLQIRKKISALTEAYNTKEGAEELRSTREMIESTLSKTFSKNSARSFDEVYFADTRPQFSDSVETTEYDMISGKTIGMLGSFLFCEQQDTPLFLPLKKYTGYKLTLSYDETPITLPARQISLF
ncbi:MAG TPA: DUF2797 domain-containing protein [Candidatus Saccharimonadales bacterium]|nr:DUF2797 domain-containing protein [Candidatus Saccharimonadales bacterium]